MSIRSSILAEMFAKLNPSLSLIYLVRWSHVELNLGEKWTPGTEILILIFI